MSKKIHCRVQEKFVRFGIESEAVRMGHFELRLSSTRIGAEPSKLTEDWKNLVEFRLLIKEHRLVDTQQL